MLSLLEQALWSLRVVSLLLGLSLPTSACSTSKFHNLAGADYVQGSRRIGSHRGAEPGRFSSASKSDLTLATPAPPAGSTRGTAMLLPAALLASQHPASLQQLEQMEAMPLIPMPLSQMCHDSQLLGAPEPELHSKQRHIRPSAPTKAVAAKR